ncbi:helix-turn-helix domain-containing protein [Lacrimispora sp. 38-1]|uniref:helix-turn-helix domain-containing protein n=1 Tax=Lacrimispora sp. 38-1 TaxID=3125778 RepID=UPI003CEA4168
MNKLGEYLLHLRTKHNYSLKFIQEQTGVTDSQQSRIERGITSDISPISLKKLSDFYEVSIIELFKMAGFINDNDLEQYSRVFSYAELLSEEQKLHIQEEINLFTGKPINKEMK